MQLSTFSVWTYRSTNDDRAARVAKTAAGPLRCEASRRRAPATAAFVNHCFLQAALKRMPQSAYKQNCRPGEDDVFRFILDEVESVPHLEALLFVWESRPKAWSAEDVADWLFVTPDAVGRILQDLARRHLIVASNGSPELFSYQSKSAERDALIQELAVTYRRELVRISNFIHSKPPTAVREFARAFRFSKERE